MPKPSELRTTVTVEKEYLTDTPMRLTAENRPATAPTLLVEAQAVGRSYRDGASEVAALVSATCSVAPADRIAIVGPSGSGKSTLLQLMAGLDLPTAGVICWPALGARETLRPANVAVIFQQHSLLDPLTVVENVELPLLLTRVSPRTARTAAVAALESLELAELCDRLPEELSGGQAQRVTVARALAVKPRLILADEPTGQLDHRTADRVVTALLQALAGTATALVIATHDAAVAAYMNQQWQIDHGLLTVNG